MRVLINAIIYILVLSALHSCNSDVFIEDIEPSVNNIELDGNGESVTIHFNSSDWGLITGECSLAEAFFHIYNAEGVNIGASGAPYLDGLGKLVLNEEQIQLTIERKHPKKLTIKVDESIVRPRFSLSMIVGNDYESKVIDVTINQCDRYVLDDISYSLKDFEYYGNGVQFGEAITINNKASTPVIQSVYPFRDKYHELKFTSYSFQAFSLLEENLMVDIPTVIDSALVMNGVRAPFSGVEQMIPLSFANEEKKVSIPPFTNQQITPVIGYDQFETDFTIRAHHPKTNKQRTITGKLRSNMPTREPFIMQKTIKE